jgi:hypothetical protein
MAADEGTGQIGGVATATRLTGVLLAEDADVPRGD